MDDIHLSLAAEELFSVGPVSVTNSMMMMFVVMALVLLVGTVIARRAQTVPTGKPQGLAEMLVGFLLDLVEGSGGKTLGRRIFPLISGIFIFILFSNMSGLLPGVGTIGVYKEHETEATEEEHKGFVNELASSSDVAVASQAVTAAQDDHDATAEAGLEDSGEAGLTEADAEHAANAEHEKTLVPFMRPPTADLNMTFALSILAFVSIQIAGISAHGVVGRIKHMADPPFLFPIEVIGEFSRILSLSARLFGNVFAGEVLLGVMYAIAAAIKIAVIPVVFPVIFIGLEVLFGTIQALVFALLTLIYIMLAAAHSHHEEEHEAETAHAATPAPAASGD